GFGACFASWPDVISRALNKLQNLSESPPGYPNFERLSRRLSHPSRFRVHFFRIKKGLYARYAVQPFICIIFVCSLAFQRFSFSSWAVKRKTDKTRAGRNLNLHNLYPGTFILLPDCSIIGKNRK